MLVNHINELNKVFEGIKKSSKIITSTMGGHGRNVLIFKDGNLNFTKDGVSVAKELSFLNTEENIGAQLLINAAKQTVKECGDGTTLTSLLIYKFMEQMIEELKNKDFISFIDESDRLVQAIKEDLTSTSSKIESATDIYNIALTSCKNEKLANLIKNIFVHSGLDANITVELSKHYPETYVEYTTGLSYDSGMVNPNFQNKDNGSCSFEKPFIYLSTDPINDYMEIDPLVNECYSTNTPLVIIAPEFSELAVRYGVTNKQKGVQLCFISTPGWADSIKHNIKDIKSFLSNGYVNKITVTNNDFTLFNNPDLKVIKKRVKELNTVLSNCTQEWERKDFVQRIGNIQQKSAIIYVGGITEKQAKEEFDRIEDAVGAVVSASKLGYQKGVGLKLYQLAQEQPQWFKNVLESPHREIMQNARITSIGEQLNTKTLEVDENLIDPTLVLITAIENSYSLIKLLITTNYVIY